MPPAISVPLLYSCAPVAASSAYTAESAERTAYTTPFATVGGTLRLSPPDPPAAPSAACHATPRPQSAPTCSATSLSLRSSENGLEFRRHTSGLRTRVGWRVPTSSPGSASADGKDRLGGGDLELPEDVGELGTDGRGLNDGPALARVADGLEPLQGADEPVPGQPGRDLGRTLDHQRQHAQPHVRGDPVRHPVEHRPHREPGRLHLPKAALDDPHALVAERDVGDRERVVVGGQDELAVQLLGSADLGLIQVQRDRQEFRVRAGGWTSTGHGPGEALAEEDGELGLGHRPRAGSHPPLLLGPVQDQEQELQGGLVGREVAPRANRPPELGVERLDGIRGVEQAPDLVGKGVERHHLAPGPAPGLADRWILPAPGPLFEGGERGLAGGGVDGAVDVLQRRGHRLAVLVGDEGQALPQQVDDAGLHGRVREDGRDRVREALQAVDDRDQDVLDPPVPQLVHDPQPELGALVLLQPQAQDFLGAVGADAQGDVDGLVPHQPLVAHLDPERVEEDQRIGRLQRPRLPCRDLVQHRVGDRADQVRRDVDAVQLAQVADDLAGAHAPRVHRDDLVVEAGEAPLVLGDQLRVEARLPVAWYRQLDPARVGDDGLAAVPVAAVAGSLLTAEVVVHLGVQRPFGERLLQLVEQAVRVEGRLRIGAGQQLVENGVGYPRLFASWHVGAPSLLSCPTAHEIPDRATPASEQSYSRLLSSTWIGRIGRKGRNRAAPAMLNMLPKLELEPIRTYLVTFSTVRRPSSTPSWTTARSCSSSTRSAACLATSAALSTETPTSAACSAEASLMPSPRNPTTWPRPLSASSTRRFCCGVTRQNRSTVSTRASSASSESRVSSSPVSTPRTGTPSPAQQWRVTRSLSPVSTLTVTPAAASDRTAPAALALGGSRNTAKPANTSSASSPTAALAWSGPTPPQAMPGARKPSSPSRSKRARRRARAASSSGRMSSGAASYEVERRSTSSGAPLTTRRRPPSPSTSTETRRRSKSNGTSSSLRQPARSTLPCSSTASSSGLLRPLSKALLR